MSRGRNTSGRPMARKASQYTEFQVTEPAELMDFLMQKMSGISRNKVKSLLSNRVVLVDNTITTQYNFELKKGMKVQISRAKNNREFKNPMLKLVYEDAYILVVEKKEGLLSVATDHQKERTAQHILNEYVKRSHRFNRVFVVHRLDRETSGLMMYAKDEKTQHTLRDNWQEIVTDRRYVSIVSGDMERDAGTIESWLTDHKLYVSSSPVDDGTGRYAVTHYKTIKRANGYSLVELDLETGRKNQIRVHMSEMGHPVIGDERYGSDCNPIGRLGLHAFKLCFYHPVTGEHMKFETPYPSAFKTLMLKKPQKS
ncbi:MAG: RluA family pseudouridine synthase [Bacteroides sp.]|nr:RluA family pseudouridine synthase [Bacteroides sp.]